MDFENLIPLIEPKSSEDQKYANTINSITEMYNDEIIRCGYFTGPDNKKYHIKDFQMREYDDQVDSRTVE